MILIHLYFIESKTLTQKNELILIAHKHLTKKVKDVKYKLIWSKRDMSYERLLSIVSLSICCLRQQYHYF